TESEFSTSATTRSPRSGEEDGRDYHFFERDEFEAKVRAGQVLEWAEYGGHLYGTLRTEVAPVLASGTNVILDIENEGAKQIRESFPSAILIFIGPPSHDELARRLRGRGDTAAGDVTERLSVAAAQMAEAPDVYDHVIVNDDLNAAITSVLDILTARAPVDP
ncbi:MAG: guanylate kinase, partial [Acidimicrobiia bacterium]